MGLIECPDCKRQISDLAPTCPECGRPNEDGRPPAPPSGSVRTHSEPSSKQGAFCTHCGEPIRAGASRCPHCGGVFPPARSNLLAGCLGLLLGPVGLWYKGHWAAGFAWLLIGIILSIASGGLVLPILWIGMALHAAAAEPRS